MNKEFPETLVCDNGIVLDKISIYQAEEKLEVIKGNVDYISEFGIWPPKDYDMAKEEEYVKNCLEGWDNGERFDYAIFDEEDIFIGSFAVVVLSQKLAKYELNYWIRQDYQAKGIMTKVLKTITDFLFEDPFPANKVIIRMIAKNIKSAKVATKCGYLLESKHFDEELSSLKGGLGDSLIFVRLRDKKKHKKLEKMQKELKKLYGLEK